MTEKFLATRGQEAAYFPRSTGTAWRKVSCCVQSSADVGLSIVLTVGRDDVIRNEPNIGYKIITSIIISLHYIQQ